MLPPIAVVIPIYVLFQRLNLLDTHAALIITYVAANLPIVIWLMRDYFSTIPIELEECAAIDGASRYRIFWSIVLPLAVPGLVATFLFVLVFAWNEYLLALFLSGAKHANPAVCHLLTECHPRATVVEYVGADPDHDPAGHRHGDRAGALYLTWAAGRRGQRIIQAGGAT